MYAPATSITCHPLYTEIYNLKREIYKIVKFFFISFGEVTLQGTSAYIFCASQAYLQHKFDHGNRRFPISLMYPGTILRYTVTFYQFSTKRPVAELHKSLRFGYRYSSVVSTASVASASVASASSVSSGSVSVSSVSSSTVSSSMVDVKLASSVLPHRKILSSSERI